MKLKSLLLLPFIITGCTGNNISSEEIRTIFDELKSQKSAVKFLGIGGVANGG